MANGLWIGNIQDGYGRCVSTGVTIEVRDPANDLVALYRDKAGTQPLGNPFITLEDGIIKFYCEAGRVNILARKGADWIVANDVATHKMGGEMNALHIVSATGIESLGEMSKDAAAVALVQRIADVLA